MSLPVPLIDRLFRRLAAAYGAQFARMWQDVPPEDAKAAWAMALDGFEKNQDAIAWALENLPERCPNAVEFRNLCRRAPAKAVPQLEAPPANPALIAQAREVLANMPRHGGGRMDASWATRVLERAAAGERFSNFALRSARELVQRNRGAA